MPKACAAQQAMDQLVERDQFLQEAGRNFEDRKQGFAHIPEPFLPPALREELKAYRQVEELFAEEDRQRMKKALKAEAQEKILSTLGEMADLAEPIVKIFLDAMELAGGFSDAKVFENSSFEWGTAVCGAIGAAVESKELLEGEDETLDKTLSPAGKEEEQRRKLLDENKKIEILKFMKDFLLTQAKTPRPLGVVKKAADLSDSSGVAQAIPIICPWSTPSKRPSRLARRPNYHLRARGIGVSQNA